MLAGVFFLVFGVFIVHLLVNLLQSSHAVSCIALYSVISWG